MLSSDKRLISTAVIPAAGLGTRLRPLTRIAPKEMLPLGRKPALEHVVEELYSVGVNCIIFVVSPSKTAIREYFGDSWFDGKVQFAYVVQEVQSGLADAILMAEDAVGGEHFLVALGDTIIVSTNSQTPTARLLAAYREYPAAAGIVVERVPRELSHLYGMVKPKEPVNGTSFEIADLIEKPQEQDSPSDYAIGGRYVFGPEVFEAIRRTMPGVGGERQITDSIRVLLESGRRAWCVPMLEGEGRYDIGNFRVYAEAFTRICMMDPELASHVRKAGGWEMQNAK